MSRDEDQVNQLIAKIRALLKADWISNAGNRFKRTTIAISKFAEENNVRPQELVSLGRRKLEGLGNKEFATMIRDFAEAESTKIETELKRRSLESEIRKKEAEAREAEIRVLHSELELIQKLKEVGVLIRTDEHGNLTVLPAPGEINFLKLENDLRKNKNA